ncbi:MAG: hypothetical protein K9I69_07530 [Ignavibacteriales bacterium]|nr:hypothetical protein [Ignavibacteriales bacterium]MCF8315036.1 hypothetical protein [Ignavibacteriales bacterium]MCF8435968.1 hypothetical protein [Ignavibacteriales bacterium]
MPVNKKNIQEIIETEVSAHGYFLIELVIRGTDQKLILEVYVDNESGVTTEACADISREINGKLELEESLKDYRLVVSSPGVDRPLKFLSQYNKHINRNFEIDYDDGQPRKLKNAKLLAIEGDKLRFQTVKHEVLIEFNRIITAKVLLSF